MVPEPGNLPKHGADILKKAYLSCLKTNPSYSDTRCAKIAWGAVKNAGYYKDKSDKWKKRSEAEVEAEAQDFLLFWSEFDRTIKCEECPKDVAKLEKIFAAADAINYRFTVPFHTSFKAAQLDTTTGKIGLFGTYLDYLATTNGWHVDPDEEPGIVSALNSGDITLRLAHSKEPERVIGIYTKGIPREDNAECPPDHPEGRHIDFEAEAIPADPQVRVNIQNGYIRDISPGLDAEVFCDVCAEPWGVDKESGTLVKTCEHKDAEGVLRNVRAKEGSIVVEPAFEGRTPFRPTFAAAMNAIFHSNSHGSSSGSLAGTRPTRPRKDGRQGMGVDTSKVGDKPMAKDPSSKGSEPVGESSKTDSEVLGQIRDELHQFNASMKAESEGRKKADDGDAPEVDKEEEPLTAETVRAALKVLKALRKMEADARKALGEGEAESEDEAARKLKLKGEGKIGKTSPVKSESESDDEDEDRRTGEDEDEDARVKAPCLTSQAQSDGIPSPVIASKVQKGAKVPSADPGVLAEKTGKKVQAGVYATVDMNSVRERFDAESAKLHKELQRRFQSNV